MSYHMLKNASWALKKDKLCVFGLTKLENSTMITILIAIHCQLLESQLSNVRIDSEHVKNPCFWIWRKQLQEEHSKKNSSNVSSLNSFDLYCSQGEKNAFEQVFTSRGFAYKIIRHLASSRTKIITFTNYALNTASSATEDNKATQGSHLK